MSGGTALAAAPREFSFDGAPVRVFDRGGEGLFVGVDVAKLLGYTNPRKEVRDRCKRPITAGGGNESFLPLDPQTVLIPEADV